VLALAENRLGNLGGMADAEDVAASVLDSLLQGARAGRFSRLINRNDLWSLLLAITRQKAISLRRYHRAKKRSAEAGRVGLEELAADEPSPEFAAVFEDSVRSLFDQLESDGLCQIARLRLEGWTNLEIADQLGVAVRTVERKLRLIHEIWSRCFEN
jgi:DNA-directed RNA polymerase specialized sigma24 family protein